MNDREKTKEQLIEELANCRQRVAELEGSKAAHSDAGESLRRSEARYRALAEASPDMIFVIGHDDTVRYVNPMAARQFDVDPDEIVGAEREVLFPPQVSAKQKEGLRQVFETGETLNTEGRITFPEGEAWLSTWLVPISHNGEIRAVMGISRDITKRKAAERELRERVKELTCLYAVQRDVQTDPTPSELCQRVVEHLVPAMQFPGLTVPVVTLDDERFTTERYEEDLPPGLRAPIEVDGESRGSVSVTYTEERPFLLPEEQKMLDNVAEMVALWLERRETSEEMARIFDMSLDLICVADMESATFIKVNPAFTETLGYSEDVLLSRPFLDLIHPDDVEPTDAVIAEELSKGKKIIAFENRYRHKDGGYRWLSWVSHPDPESGRIYAVARDVTEQKRRERELLRHREHLEEMVEERTWTIQRQTEEILALSTPVLEVLDGVIAVPLIGTLDSRRAQRFMDVLLEQIAVTDAAVALIDITGVPTIDTQTAQHLIEAIAAARLLGPRMVLTGVRPSIAQSLVHLGIDLSDLITRSSLAAGLRVAEEMVG
jgi:PAS domain S-box-containing protein